MTRIIVPNTNTGARVLFIIDAQPNTLNGDKASNVLDKIVKYVEKSEYDAYVVAEYFAPSDSMFAKQVGHLLTQEQAGETDERIMNSLKPYKNKTFRVIKTVSSCFNDDRRQELLDFLKKIDASELHFIGFDINDCVLGSVKDAGDSGFFSFAIEELCHNCRSDQELVDATVKILRYSRMTNNSLLDETKAMNTDI